MGSKKRKKLLGWTQYPAPNQSLKNKGRTDWFSQLSEVYVSNDQKYCVMSREIDTDMGKVTHMCIRSQGRKETGWQGEDIPWAEKQRIKNEIYGKELTAIEVFPKESELVDEANMYHLWILHDFKLPFGID